MALSHAPGGIGLQRQPAPTLTTRHRAPSRAVPFKVVTVVAVLAMAAAVSTRLASSKQLGGFGHLLVSVPSGSMAPLMDAGDLQVDEALTAAQAEHLHPDQIISFRSRGGRDQIMTSRIMAVASTPDGGVAYVTRADAHDSQDPLPTRSTDVIGVYQSTIPYGGYLIDALHRPLPLSLLLASLLVWLLSEPYRRRAREEAEAAHQELTFEDR